MNAKREEFPAAVEFRKKDQLMEEAE